MKKSAHRLIKIFIYILCIYTLYLYLSEIIAVLRIGIELPVLKFMTGVDGFLLLLGGIFLGGLLIKIGGPMDKSFGISMIAVNVIIGGSLLMDALV